MKDLTTTEDRMMLAALTMMIVGVAMMLFAAVFMFVGVGIALLKGGAVGEADQGRAVVVEAALEDGASAGMNGGNVVVRVRTRGERRLDAPAVDADLHDGEGDVADVGDDDLAAAEPPAEPGRDAGAGEVAKLLSADGTPGEVGGDCGHGCGGAGSERGERGAAGHDPLDDASGVHGGNYTK